MMNFVKVVTCLMLVVASKTVSATSVELPTLIMQLRSTVDTSNSQLLSDMLTLTTQYLDSYFGAYYSNVQPVDYFTHTALSVNSFGIHGVEGSYITTLEFDGMLLFSAEPLPAEQFVNTLLTNAFQHLNQEMYLTSLLTSKNEFLSGLTHVIIEVNDEPITEEGNLSDRSSNGDDSDKDWYDGEWLHMVVYGTAGLAGAILLVCLILVCKCVFCKDRRQVDEIGHEDRPVPSKLFVDAPKANKTNKTSKAGNRFNIETPMSVADADMYTTVEAPTQSQSQSRSPSPERSIASQDSSKFTYNNVNNTSKISVGSMSNLQIDMPSIELDPWQKVDTISPVTPAPFGNDISAIEHQEKEKDLSLIEEGNEDSFGASAIAAAIAARASRRHRKALDSSQGIGYSSHHSQSRGSSKRSSSSDLEIRKSRSSTRKPSTTGNPSSTARQSHLSLSSVAAMSYPQTTSHMHGSMLGPTNNESYSQEDSKSIVSDSSSDVINDLRNLSLQIDRHRRARSSGGY